MDQQEASARKAAQIRWAKSRKEFDGDWRPVPGWIGYYASADGQVRSEHQILRASSGKYGHLFVCPSVAGKQRPEAVHRMVCAAFNGACPQGMECRHLDGNPTNNKPENLAWGTKLENQRDRLAHGTDNSGARNGRSKMTEAQVIAIYARAKAGESRVIIAEEFGTTVSQVGLIAAGFRWSKTTGALPRKR